MQVIKTGLDDMSPLIEQIKALMGNEWIRYDFSRIILLVYDAYKAGYNDAKEEKVMKYTAFLRGEPL